MRLEDVAVVGVEDAHSSVVVVALAWSPAEVGTRATDYFCFKC